MADLFRENAENPDDDCQCARCGSSAFYETCENCGGSGYSDHDCGEDSCCCLHPDDNVACDCCEGEGGGYYCCSPSEWCVTHPLPGREGVRRGRIEWFSVSPSNPERDNG